MDIFSPIFLVLILSLTLLLLILKQIKSAFSKGPNLPPGPPPLPLIGNIHQVGKKPHVSMAQFSKEYGPLISLRLGTQLLVAASSPAAAAEILKTHDRLLSSRHVPRTFSHDFEHLSLIWGADCNDHWKSLRALFRTELFSVKALESQFTMREEKVGRMLDFLRSQEGQVMKIGQIVFTTIFNTLSNIIFSKDFLDLEDEGGAAGGLKATLFEILEMGATPNIGDFYPILDKLDLQGLRRTNLKLTEQVYAKWESIISERRKSNNFTHSSSKQDFLNRMLALGFSNDQINLLAIEIFIAGTDTTSSTIEWGMAELVKNKEAMQRVREELSREISWGSMIKESQAYQLPYLNACVKETLRLHPPAPFLLPHRASETCQVMNYTIPQNSQILVNVWAIGRDPFIWDDPLSFKPERFLDSKLDYKGHDFEYLPFGSGRRICPGIPSATKQVPFILASLIHHFDWLLPGDEDPSQLDMNDKFGETLHKEQPLKLIFKHK